MQAVFIADSNELVSFLTLADTPADILLLQRTATSIKIPREDVRVFIANSNDLFFSLTLTGSPADILFARRATLCQITDKNITVFIIIRFLEPDACRHSRGHLLRSVTKQGRHKSVYHRRY